MFSTRKIGVLPSKWTLVGLESPIAAPLELHAPEVVFLLRLFVVSIAVNRDRHAKRIRLRPHRKRLHWLQRRFGRKFRGRSVYHSRLCRNNLLNERRRLPRRLMGVANQFEQVVIFHVLDLVRQPHKAPVDVVERAPIELISQLFTPDAERMSPRMLAQYQL